MNKICYLCNEPILPDQKISGDHVYPKGIMKREQPKVKGFDYAGKVDSHENCNNEFGPERFVKKALQLIHVFFDPKCFNTFQHKKEEDIRIFAIISECLKDFTKSELKYFKMIDVTNEEYNKWREPEYLRQHEAVDPYKLTYNPVLSVLAKSSASFLIKRYKLSPLQKSWRILALINESDDINTDLDDYFGETKPLDIGVTAYVRLYENNEDYFIVYKYEKLFVYFFFAFKEGQDYINQIKNIFDDQEAFLFQSDKLINLINYDWLSNRI